MEWHTDIPSNCRDNIVVGDATQLIKTLPDDSIDLVVTSPPYNLGSRYANVSGRAIQGKWSRVIQYGTYTDDMEEDDYVAWQRGIIRELWRVIKPTGAIYYNHRPRIQQGRVLHRIDLIPDDVTLRQIIVWVRPKGHNFNIQYHVPSYEWIFLISKEAFALSDSGLGDVWEMNPTTSAKSDGHVAPFPIDIPMRAINTACNVEVVLDPFIGSGTTAVAAKQLGKHWVGFELDEAVASKARARINQASVMMLLPDAEQTEMFK